MWPSQTEQELGDGQETTILLCFLSRTKHVLLQPDSLSVCGFSQWISHSQNQSVSSVYVVYRLIWVSTRTSIYSVHSQLTSTVLSTSWASQQIPDITTSQSVQLVKCIRQPQTWQTAGQSSLTNKALSKRGHQQLCFCLGCQNLWTIKIAIFKHNNKEYQSYWNSFRYVIFSSPLENHW